MDRPTLAYEDVSETSIYDMIVNETSNYKLADEVVKFIEDRLLLLRAAKMDAMTINQIESLLR